MATILVVMNLLLALNFALHDNWTMAAVSILFAFQTIQGDEIRELRQKIEEKNNGNR